MIRNSGRVTYLSESFLSVMESSFGLTNVDGITLRGRLENTSPCDIFLVLKFSFTAVDKLKVGIWLNYDMEFSIYRVRGRRKNLCPRQDQLPIIHPPEEACHMHQENGNSCIVSSPSLFIKHSKSNADLNLSGRRSKEEGDKGSSSAQLSTNRYDQKKG